MNCKLPTQCLSVQVLLNVAHAPYNTIKIIEQTLQQPPWHLHHIFQLFDVHESNVVEKKEFFELKESLPLFLFSKYDSNKPLKSALRFNILVKNRFEEMRVFYCRLLNLPMIYETPNFCCFVFLSNVHFEVQLSLKYCKALNTYPTNNATLKIGNSLFSNSFIQTVDPEGNNVLVYRNAHISRFHCRCRRTEKERSEKESVFARCRDFQIPIATIKKTTKIKNVSLDGDCLKTISKPCIKYSNKRSRKKEHENNDQALTDINRGELVQCCAAYV